jgi:hypothetical protein
MKRKIFTVIAGLMIMSLVISSCNMGEPAPTPTPIPTSTFTPTTIPSATSTSTPTDTPTPTATPLPTGKHVDVLEDGSFVFLDYDMKYGMIYPSTWYVVPFDSDDEAAATEQLIAVDASYGDMLAALKPLMDFIAVKPSDESPKDADGVATGIALEGDVYTQMSLPDVLAAQQVPADATVLYNEVITNASGVEMGLLEYENSQNHTVVCIFKTEKGAMVISLASSTPKFESISQEMIDIVGLIGLLE